MVFDYYEINAIHLVERRLTFQTVCSLIYSPLEVTRGLELLTPLVFWVTEFLILLRLLVIHTAHKSCLLVDFLNANSSCVTNLHRLKTALHNLKEGMALACEEEQPKLIELHFNPVPLSSFSCFRIWCLAHFGGCSWSY